MVRELHKVKEEIIDGEWGPLQPGMNSLSSQLPTLSPACSWKPRLTKVKWVPQNALGCGFCV